MEGALIREMDILFKKAEIKFDFGNDSYRWETALFCLALLMANMSLFKGSPAGALAFHPAAVASGEWWRVFTFPFVHVSFYNLLLDGSAFLLLYHGLEETSRYRRLLYVAAGMAGSLILPLFVSPIIGSVGLAGLSGCAHGLMAITGLELIAGYPKGDTLKKMGIILVFIVVLKSLMEAINGQVMFAWLHFGDVGTPVAESHLGGLLGAVSAYLLVNRRGDARS